MFQNLLVSQFCISTQFFVTDFATLSSDGLHGWVLQRIKKGNMRNRAQILSEVVPFLEEEEAKKTTSSVERFFAVTNEFDEPRIGSGSNGIVNCEQFDFHKYRISKRNPC